ncbi:MAG: VRR-NUC domain-containing protein [bacterium]
MTLPFMIVQAEEIPLSTGEIFNCPKANMYYHEWAGTPLKDTYGGKTVLDIEGEPLFAELAILKLIKDDGWDGVWVDNYRKTFRNVLPEKGGSVSIPANYEKVINAIKEINGTLNGCWDLFAWKGNKLLFVESKRFKKDKLRDTQVKWLESALKSNFEIEYLIVEWDLDSN